MLSSEKRVRGIAAIFLLLPVVALVIYVVFFMPLPYVNPLWSFRSLQPRMAQSAGERMLGFSRDEVIDRLGEPTPRTVNVLHGPDAIAYMVRARGMRHYFLIIWFDDDIAVEAQVVRS
ncbi:MAG: hypothetical protein FWG38_06435 [Defluviitaleaceae bacterium]|nr:hypothetical protein [Defluviitaleaceae bacterium]